MGAPAYVGRFAPSPTGPLHAGSLVAAMASFLDARVHDGMWQVRIEDVDTARSAAGANDAILASLARLGMVADGEIMLQRDRFDAYQAAFNRLSAHIYPCACTRRELADSLSRTGPDGGMIYPGTCRNGVGMARSTYAYRLRLPAEGDPAGTILFEDRWAGTIATPLPSTVGDFILKRADGVWAYQLAVVVDDAAQAITHVVRGADLLDSTGRQIYLQSLLGLPTPRYLHVPVVMTERGEKLSKQTGADAIDGRPPLACLHEAAHFLGMAMRPAPTIGMFWMQATAAWKRRCDELAGA